MFTTKCIKILNVSLLILNKTNFYVGTVIRPKMIRQAIRRYDYYKCVVVAVIDIIWNQNNVSLYNIF